MNACHEEMTLRPRVLKDTTVVVVECGSRLVGVAQVCVDGLDCDLLKLFIHPEHIGQGHGAALFRWAVQEGRRLGARRMTIEADPEAEPFYRRMGARTIGQAPSGSIPGRNLPLLDFPLTDASPWLTTDV